jgi:hypothetical protein
MIVRVLIAWALIAAAIGLAVLVHRTRKVEGKPPEEDELPDYRVVLGFVASAYGLLLGLLIVFAVGHHSDARRQAQAEATSLVALYGTADVYPRNVAVPFKRDLVCYMRSIVSDDWPSMEDGNSTEAPRALAFGDQVRANVRQLPLDNDRESSAYSRAASQMVEADKARQQLLFFTEPEVPDALWALVYVGAFLIVFLIALHYTDNPRGRNLALAAMIVLITVVVGALAALDRPFGFGARVDPKELRQAITLVSVGAERAIVAPCPDRPQS